MAEATLTDSRALTGSSRVAPVIAIVAGSLLLIKVGLIIATGNTLPGALEGGLYLGGVLLPLAAAPGLAAAILPGASRLARIGLTIAIGVAHLFFIMALSDGIGALVENVTDTKYLVDEVPVAVAGLAWVLIGTAFLERARRHPRL
jgi:hypothetical protein